MYHPKDIDKYINKSTSIPGRTACIFISLYPLLCNCVLDCNFKVSYLDLLRINRSIKSSAIRFGFTSWNSPTFFILDL